MSDQYNEIEVKLHVPDLDAIAARLDDLGATVDRPRTYERNLRYQDVAKTFHDRGVILRLRQDDRVRLTYKEPMDSDSAARGMHDRFEVEVVVDDYDAMHTILERLGFHGIHGVREVPHDLSLRRRGNRVGRDALWELRGGRRRRGDD